jgi:hypothetical protein
VVARCGASDRSTDQPAPAHSERGKHVFATGAPHLASGSGSVVRLCLGQLPDPHVIRPPWKPAPGCGMGFPASLPVANGSPGLDKAPAFQRCSASVGFLDRMLGRTAKPCESHNVAGQHRGQHRAGCRRSPRIPRPHNQAVFAWLHRSRWAHLDSNQGPTDYENEARSLPSLNAWSYAASDGRKLRR